LVASGDDIGLTETRDCARVPGTTQAIRLHLVRPGTRRRAIPVGARPVASVCLASVTLDEVNAMPRPSHKASLYVELAQEGT
jgi:hypothetical protein